MDNNDDLPADTPWYARILIENIREAWKLASVWWPGICAGVSEAYAADPAGFQKSVQSIVPENLWPHLLAAAFIVSIVARVTKQKGTP